MPSQGEFSIGLLDLVLLRIALHAQNLIIVLTHVCYEVSVGNIKVKRLLIKTIDAVVVGPVKNRFIRETLWFVFNLVSPCCHVKELS